MAKSKIVKARIRLVRSQLGRKPNQRKTVRALGLNRIGSTNVLEMTDAVRGMVNTVSHLVRVEEIE